MRMRLSVPPRLSTLPEFPGTTATLTVADKILAASNLDLLAYFKDAATHGYAGLSNDSYLLGVQTGFEVYSGTWTTSCSPLSFNTRAMGAASRSKTSSAPSCQPSALIIWRK